MESTNTLNTSLNNIDTPMMRQFKEMKAQSKDKLLFFRMGDFYELFGEDAIIAAPILGIALTVRDKKNSIPMCGIPYHAVNNYISKLTNKGHTVAICEQLEDPKTVKGLVKRGIVRIVTPSLAYDPEAIEKQNSLYLVSISSKYNSWSYSALEYSTGKFFVDSVKSVEELIDRLQVLGVSELVYYRDLDIPLSIQNFLQNINFTVLDLGKRDLHKENLFGIMLDKNIDDTELLSAKSIIYYLKTTQFKENFPHITYLAKASSAHFLSIDEFSVKNLELTTELFPKINYTKTAMGARLLYKTILEPLNCLTGINIRQNNVEFLLNNMEKTSVIKKELSKIPDIERLNMKVLNGLYNPQTVLSLFIGIKNSIEIIRENKNLFNKLDTDFAELYAFTESKIPVFSDTVPAGFNKYGIFVKGYSAELDSLIDLTEEVNNILKDIEERERKATGIQNLKIKFNKVFGYYIELSKGASLKAPEHYTRKQTLVNAERFITEELKDLETRVLEAEEKRLSLEKELLQNLISEFLPLSKKLSYLSVLVSEIDIIQSFAELAYEHNYVKPSLEKDFDLILENARHPILEHYLKENFIPNDINFNKENFFHIVTGPNMSGKSTVMRSVSLIIILAHMGSFVPASKAKIPLTDKIFTRVGATDYISRGQSTFMVEMVETANILRSATKNSFIIIDEIGRGTSTFDGISIAWAVAEFLNKEIGAKTMFATHYHELTILDDLLEGTKNYSMDVEEDNKNLIFTRKYINKPAQKSYGINVAKMAGLPKSVLTKATSILNKFEKEGRITVNLDSKKQRSLFEIEQFVEPKELKEKIEIDPDLELKNAIFSELKNIDPNTLTPIDALSLLYRWKEENKTSS